ncbi:MAG: hypothetical protein C4339_05660 [Nitrososphaerota archaeon]
MGYLAGENAAGGDLEFPGVLGSAITKFGAPQIGRVGLTEREARERGLRITSQRIAVRTRAHYYPGLKEIHLKLIATQEDDRLLGAQLLGYEGVWGRLNVLAMAIASGMTARQLFLSDLAYAPPFGPVRGPIIVGARVLLR